MSKKRFLCLLFLELLILSASLQGADDPFLFQESRSFDDFYHYREIFVTESPMNWYQENQNLLLNLPPGEQSILLDRMERDILRWSEKEFESLLPPADYDYFVSSLSELNTLWTFQTEEGKVLFDAYGDPLLLSGEPGQINNDRTSWLTAAERLEQTVIDRWLVTGESVMDSFLKGIPDEYKNKVEETLALNLKDFCSLIEKESDRLINWSSVKMNYLRSEDNYSLRHKSEEQSAESFADQLLSDIQNELEEVRDSLDRGLEDLSETTMAEGLSAGSEDWEALFRREFQKGLDKWADAEESFLAERLGWELRAEKEFQESEESWSRAFTMFAAAQKEWASALTQRMETGLAFWQEEEDAFMLDFRSIAQDLETAALEQEEKFSTQVESALSLYSESSSLLISAEENLSYYLNKIEYCSTKIDGLGQSILSVSDAASVNEAHSDNSKSVELKIGGGLVVIDIEDRLDEISDLKEELSLYQDEYNLWQSLKISLKNQMDEARIMLFDLEAAAYGYDNSVATGTLDRDLHEMRGRSDRLKEQWAISEAVIAYAITDSSLRDTEAETAAQFESAEYELSLRELDYNDAIQSLKILRENLSLNQLEIDDLRVLLAGAEAAMREAENKYESSNTVFLSDDPEIIETVLKDLQKKIDLWFLGNSENGPERNTVFMNFIAAGEWERRNEYKDRLESVLRDLTGSELPQESDDFENIDDLRSALESVHTIQGFNQDPGLEDSLVYLEKVQALEYSIEWNLKVQEYLSDVSDLEAVPLLLQPDEQSGEISLLIDKTVFLQELMITFNRGADSSVHLINKYLDFLKENDFTVEPDDLNAVSGLLSVLHHSENEGQTLQGIEDLLSDEESLWLEAVQYGNHLLPGGDYLELFISENRITVLKADAAISAFESVSSLTSSFGALSGEGFLHSVTGEEFIEKLDAFDSFESFINWYLPLQDAEVFPQYMELGLNAYILQAYSNDLDSFMYQDGELQVNEERVLVFVNRLRSLQTSDQSPSLKDQSFIERILIESLKAVQMDTVSTPAEASRTYLNRFYENELGMNSYKSTIDDMEYDLQLKNEDGQLFKELVVDRDRDQLFIEKEEYESVFQDLRTALDAFHGAQNLFLQGQESVQLRYNEYRDASLTYQQAKEILDYARGAYSSETFNIFTVREARKSAYDRCMTALNILEQLETGSSSPSDENWSELLLYEQDLLSITNKVSYARQELVKELGELNQQQSNTLRDITEISMDLINFSFRDGLSFSYDSDLMEQGISSFKSWKNSHYNQHLEDYFSKEDSSEIFTKDLLLWLEQISNHGNTSEILKLFSYAYYHELRQMEGMDWDRIKTEYTIDILNDPRHADLLDTDGSLFKSVHIAYEGDLERYKNGEYETVCSVIMYEGEYLRVFIEGEEWLQEQTASSFNQVKNNANLSDQYLFYKMLMFSKAFSSDSLKHAMEKDLSMLAWEYIDARAAHEQNKFKSIWGGYTRTGRAIRDKRNTLEDSSRGYNGIGYRSAAAFNADDSSALLQSFNIIGARMKTLTPDDFESVEKVQNLLNQICGISFSEEQKIINSEVFSTLSSFDRSSALHLLDGLLDNLFQMTSRYERKRLLREEELRSVQREQRLTLQTIYNAPVWDEGEYSAAAGEFYLNSSYSCEESGLQSLDAFLNAENPYGQDSLYTLQSYGRQLIRNFQDRLSVVKEDKYNTLRIGLESLYRQKEYWEQLCEGLGREGLNQWSLSLRNLKTERKNWHQQVGREFESKSELWEDKYSFLLNQKNSWVQKSSRNVLEYGAHTFAREWDLEADRLISEVSFKLISDLVTETDSAAGLVQNVLKGRTMNTLLRAVENTRLRSTGVHNSLAILPAVPDKQSALLRIDQSNQELSEKVYKAMAYSRALQMKELVDHVEISINGSIEDANRSVDASVEAQLGDAGYIRQGNFFFRTVLIDSSIFGGNESEEQSLESYRYFRAPDFDHNIDLRPEYLVLLSSEMIQASVELAQERLNRYINLVFGNEDDHTIRTGLDQSFISLLEQAETDYGNSAQFDDEENSEKRGLFNFYLGYAPVMKEESPEEIETSGYGEFGRIYEKFFIHQARLFRGLSSVNTPWYTQKLWDDDSDNDGESDNLLGAPNVRSLADIALNIAGNFFMPGIGSLLLNLVDDALFSIMDFGNGLADMGQISMGFLKKTAGSLISFGTGSLNGFMDNLSFLQNSGMTEVAGDIGIRGLSSVASNYSTAALYSLDPDSHGWNWNTFNSMTSWENSGAGYLSGLTGTAVSGTLNLGTFGFLGEIGDDANSFTNLIGGLSASGVEYAMTGRTSLNLMNLGRTGTGFLEMNLGSDGSLFNFGTRGTDVSLGTLSSAARGAVVYSENRNISTAVERDLRAGMRALYSSGLDETKSLYQDILEGSVLLTQSENQEYQGYTSVDESGQRVIDLNLSGQSRLDLAVLLSHEAFRDGIKSDDESQILETIDAATGHMAIGSELQKRYGSFQLSRENNQEAFAYRLYAQGAITRDQMTGYIQNNYDTSDDYWKRLNDGRIISDGRAGLYDEIGNLIRVATDGAGNQLDEMDSLKYYIDSESAEYLTHLTPEQRSQITYYRSSDDVNRQVDMRDAIINDYDILRNLNSKSILTGSDYQKAMESLFQSMAVYNNEFVLRGIAITPEGVISQDYGNRAYRMETRKDGETQYLSYTHPGIDTTGGAGVYSPGFAIPGEDVKNYAFGMDMVGMENNYLIEHLNPADINELLLKELLYPGQKLMDFPELMYPNDGGGTDAHAHIEVSSYNSEAEAWGFSDPTGNWSDWSAGEMFPGYYEWLDVDEYGDENWTLNAKSFWKKWKPWVYQ